VNKRLAFALISGLIFGVGLVLSGMTVPQKIIGFLDVTGAWDPSLAFVMVGAIAVHFTGLRLTRRRTALAGELELNVESRPDARLLIGSAIFGVGWGLAGYCPGPALVSAAGGGLGAITVAIAIVAGVGLYELVLVPRAARTEEPSCAGADLV
jgi:uncharacterized protein